MRIILAALFMTLVTQVVAEGRLPDVFWVECSGKTLIGAEKHLLVRIDREKKTWEQKLPRVNTYQICADNEDVIRYKTSPEKDCSDYTDFYLNKWSGNLVGMGNYNCEILDASPKPKWSDAPQPASPNPVRLEHERENAELASVKKIYPRLRPQNFDISQHTDRDESNTRLEDILKSLSESKNVIKPTPSVGPPLTQSEVTNFNHAISDCWQVDDELKYTEVTVGFELMPNGKVKPGSFELVRFSGRDRNLAYRAYTVARRAIQKCELNGYNLPKEKYAHWRRVEMTFKPR